MQCYSAFGLIISSPRPIPDFITLSESDCRDVDVFISESDIPLPQKETRFNPFKPGRRKVWGNDNDITLFWRGICAARIEKGCRVTIMNLDKKPRPGFMRAVIIGPVMGLILYQRLNHFLFHSSVISRADGSCALAFMAKKGGGKSSQAAAFLNHGYKFVSDDLLAVEKDTSPPMVQPGFPGLKLWEHSAKKLVNKGEDLPQIGPGGDYNKRSLNKPETFHKELLSLKAIIILEYSVNSDPHIIPLNEKEAFMELIPHWYGAQFKGQLLPILGYGRHFAECTAMIKSVPVLKLVRPSDISRIDETIQVIEDYLIWAK